MLRRQQHRNRRGLALVIVLAMLGLFMALGLSFSQLAKLEAQGALNFKLAPKIGAAASANSPETLLTEAITQLLYDTTNEQSAIRGHSLARDKFGGLNAIPRAPNAPYTAAFSATDPSTWKRGVFSGTGIFNPRDFPNQTGGNIVVNDGAITYTLFPQDGIIGCTTPTYSTSPHNPTQTYSEVLYYLSRQRPNREFHLAAPPFSNAQLPAGRGFRTSAGAGLGVLEPVYPWGNFTVFDARGTLSATTGRPVTGQVGPVGGLENPQPERFWDSTNGEWCYFPFNEDYDSVDHNNLALSLERADGQIIQPSFHRPYLIRQLELAGGFTNTAGTQQIPAALTGAAGLPQAQYPAWTGDRDNGRKVIFRPRRVDFNATAVLGAGGSGWTDPEDVNRNGIVGDIPEELDVDTDGDGKKDAIWVYLGHRPIRRGAGYVLPLFAFKVVDLDGKINLNTAGNLYDDRLNPANPQAAVNMTHGHYSHHGASQAEINPKHLGLVHPNEIPVATSISPLPFAAPLTLPRLMGWNVLDINTSGGGGQRWLEYARLFVGDLNTGTRGKWNPQFGTLSVIDKPGVNATADYATEPMLASQAQTVGAFANVAVDWLGWGQTWEPFTAPGAYLVRNTFTAVTDVNYYRQIGWQSVNSRGFGFNDLVNPLFRAGPAPNADATAQDFPWQAAGENVPANSMTPPGGTTQGLTAAADLAVQDFPQELNLYGPASGSTPIVSQENDDPSSPNDSPFLASEAHRLLRPKDIDSDSLERRLEFLMPTLFNYAHDPYPTAGTNAEKVLWSRREYARDRIRKLATTMNWDLSRFSMPPTFSSVTGGSGAGSENWASHAGAAAPLRHFGVFGQINAGTTMTTLGNCTNSTNDNQNRPRTRYPFELQSGQRFDLNQRFTDYTTDATTADNERTDVAEQIFTILMLAARIETADDPTEVAAKARVIAQIAVNIVDFMDADSVMTKLTYPNDVGSVTAFYAGTATSFPTTASVQNTVFGFELPELVINEGVSVSHQFNDPMDGVDKDKVFVWCELRNPWPHIHNETGTRSSSRTAVLHRGPFNDANNSVYQIRLNDSFSGAQVIDFTDTTGANGATIDPATQGGYQVNGDDGSASGGLYLVGPDTPDTTVVPTMTPLLANWNDATSQNHFTARNFSYNHDTPQASYDLQIELRRLRNPFLPLQGNPANAGYNPYVRIDYVDLTNGTGTYKTSIHTTVEERYSRERRQPWVGQGTRPWNHEGATMGDATEDRVGNYIGFPAIGTGIAPANRALWTTTAAAATSYGGYTAKQAPGFLQSGDGTNGNTLSLRGSAVGRNERDAFGYLSFPFLNRPLASPLDLLSVRMYGSSFHPSAGSIPSPPPGTPAGEWQLRFTDDYEFVVSTTNFTFPGVYRSRQVDWFADARMPAGSSTYRPWAGKPAYTNQGVIPDLYRFFEFVECHDRFNTTFYTDGGGAVRRKIRQAGKLNINTITDEEVFRALFDAQEVMPAQAMTPTATIGANIRRLPGNYPFNAFRNLGTNSLTRSSNRLTGNPFAPPAIPQNLWGGTRETFYVAGSAEESEMWSIATQQWPGIYEPSAGMAGWPPAWPASQSSTVSAIPAGRDAYMQVNSEMFRQFLLSRNGMDQIYGTGDDKPFRSFAGDHLRDTILRKRATQFIEVPEDRPFDPTTATPYDANSGEVGEYITGTNLAAAGQYVPRLFDPIDDPYSPYKVHDPNLYNPANATAAVLEMNLKGGQEMFGANADGPWFDRDAGVATYPDNDPHNPADYWMLEYRRNKLLGKIANNTTTRSNVYAAWVTVGFFKVEPGSEGFTVPLINEEDGLATGSVIRHRAFTIIDRSRLNEYNGPNSAPASLQGMEALVLPEKVHFIE